MRRSSPYLAVVVMAALSVSATAVADDLAPNRRRPPKIRLVYKGEVVQRASPYTFCWSYEEPDGGVIGMCGDGLPRYKKAAKVSAPARVVIRIPYPVKPTEWYVEAHRAIIRHENWDEPVGPAEEIPFKLRPRRVDGEIRGWKVILRLEEPARHYYLNTGGWLEQGDVSYVLHVRT